MKVKVALAQSCRGDVYWHASLEAEDGGGVIDTGHIPQDSGSEPDSANRQSSRLRRKGLGTHRWYAL